MVLGLSSTALADEWKEYKSAEGHYSVLFAGTPQQTTQRMDTKVGKLDAKVTMLAIKDDVFYAVAFVDYPKDAVATAKPDDLLNGARDGAVTNVNGTLVSEEKITMGGYPGRELKISAPGDLSLSARIYLVKARLYQTIVVAHKAKENVGDTKKFLTSFKFTE
jgi:hypothetical protein